MNTSDDKKTKTSAAAKTAAAKRELLLTNNRLDSIDLFAGGREVTIAHGEEIYRLRLTAQNKLILTK